jgi:hypothetical protein
MVKKCTTVVHYLRDLTMTLILFKLVDCKLKSVKFRELIDETT